MDKLFFLFFGMYVLGLLIRFIFELQKKAGKVDAENKLIFAVIFTAMCMLWSGWFNMPPVDPFPIALPPVVRWIGFGLFIAGLCLAVGAFIQLKGLENIDHLVTTGLFAKVRHPMYTGFMFWIIGWPLYHGAAISLAAGILAFVSILFWRNLEEKHMAHQFGDAYRKYCQTTWF